MKIKAFEERIGIDDHKIVIDEHDNRTKVSEDIINQVWLRWVNMPGTKQSLRLGIIYREFPYPVEINLSTN